MYIYMHTSGKHFKLPHVFEETPNSTLEALIYYKGAILSYYCFQGSLYIKLGKIICIIDLSLKSTEPGLNRLLSG